jgi:hypothetical protein
MEQEEQTQVEQAPVETQEEKKSSGGSAFYKQKIEQLERERREFQEQLEVERSKQLQEKENYKELWEIEKTKRTAAEEKAMRVSQSYLTGLKMSAIEQEALKQGIIPEALTDIRPDDATMVEIETGDRGSVNILGVKEYVEHLRENKRHWFKQAPPMVNNHRPGEPNTTISELSPAEMIALQKTDPNKYAEEIKKRLKLA